MSEPFSVDMRDAGGHARVTVAGEVTGRSIQTLRHALTAVCAMYSDVTVDVSRLVTPEPEVLVELLDTRDRLAARGGRLEIAGVTASGEGGLRTATS